MSLKKYKKVVYTSGTWDLFHVGHLNMIERAAKFGDFLIVGVSTDELVRNYKHRSPAIPYEERFQIIRALKYPNLVIAQHKQFHLSCMIELNVSIIIMGDDWSGSDNPDLIKLKDRFNLVFLPRTKHISSTKLKKQIYISQFKEVEE